MEYRERFYRDWVKRDEMVTFHIQLKESDLLIKAERDLKEEAMEVLKKIRKEIEDYIRRDPLFLKTLKPYHVKEGAPGIIKEMARMARRVKVGPMAGVAGAVAEWVGRALLPYSREIIVENGGDIFLNSSCERKIGVFAGKSSFRRHLLLKISPEICPVGICTSSATVGHSLSFGKADAVVVLSSSAILADAAATSLGNRVKRKEDIPHALRWIAGKRGILGAVIIMGDCLGIWGEIEIWEGGMKDAHSEN